MPTKGDKLRNVWIQILASKSNITINEQYDFFYLCPLHFKKEDVNEDGKLKKGALPLPVEIPE